MPLENACKHSLSYTLGGTTTALSSAARLYGINLTFSSTTNTAILYDTLTAADTSTTNEFYRFEGVATEKKGETVTFGKMPLVLDNGVTMVVTGTPGVIFYYVSSTGIS